MQCWIVFTLRKLIFKELCLGTQYCQAPCVNDAKLEAAVFEDTIIGYIDLHRLCANKTIGDEGRVEIGCQ